MMVRKLLMVLIILLIRLELNAQKSITTQSLIWYGYFQTIQFSSNYYWQSEIQERHFINPIEQHQLMIRGHLHKLLGNSGWETSAGMCIFLQSPNDPISPNRLITPELRPHIEFANKQKLNHISLDHRYRMEGRFFHNTNMDKTELEEGFGFGNYRFRYRLQATIPILKIDSKRSLRLKVSDEIHINLGSKIIKNVFEQNRIYGGISIDLLSNLALDLGYLNWFQQRSSGDFYNRNIFRITVFHKIKL